MKQQESKLKSEMSPVMINGLGNDGCPTTSTTGTHRRIRINLGT